MAIAPSLFDFPGSPVLPMISTWVNGTLFGGLATSLCNIAVALAGIMLMLGRLVFRDALRVALASFVELGAGAIAGGIRLAADQTVISPQIEVAPSADWRSGSLDQPR